jgi:hypothetical protein
MPLHLISTTVGVPWDNFNELFSRRKLKRRIRAGYVQRGGTYPGSARGGGRGAYGGGRGYGAAPTQQGYDQSYYGAGYEDPYAGYGAEAYGAGYDYSGYDYSGYDASAYAAGLSRRWGLCERCIVAHLECRGTQTVIWDPMLNVDRLWLMSTDTGCGTRQYATGSVHSFGILAQRFCLSSGRSAS